MVPGVTAIFNLLEKAVTGRSLAKAWARALAWPDFEDAVCAATWAASACDSLVTRTPDGYPNPPLPVIDPPRR